MSGALHGTRPVSPVAGLPGTTTGLQLNRFCASGLEAVNTAAQKVCSGSEELVLAVGVESMSRAPVGPALGAAVRAGGMACQSSAMPVPLRAGTAFSGRARERAPVPNWASLSMMVWPTGRCPQMLMP